MRLLGCRPDRGEARLRRVVDVVQTRLPGREIGLVADVEEEEPDHVRLARGELQRDPVVGRLRPLGDGVDRRRRRGIRVELQLPRPDRRLDAELVVQDRQPAAALPGVVERLRQEPDELVVVVDRDHARRARVLERRGDPRLLHVRMEGEDVHDRPPALALPVSLAEVADEGRGRVRVAARPRLVEAARRDGAADHGDLRGDRLQRVVGLREQRLIGGGGSVGASRLELGGPEPPEVGLVADDVVGDAEGLELGRHGDGVGDELLPRRGRERRSLPAARGDRDEQADPALLRGGCRVLQREQIPAVKLHDSRIPARRHANRGQAGEHGQIHLRLRDAGLQLFRAVLGGPDE